MTNPAFTDEVFSPIRADEPVVSMVQIYEYMLETGLTLDGYHRLTAKETHQIKARIVRLRKEFSRVNGELAHA